MNKHRAGLPLHILAGGFACGIVRRAKANRGAEATDVFLLHLRRIVGHDDERRDAAPLGGVCERCAVIAGRMRDNAAARFIFAQREHRVAGAASLECTDPLKILAFEIQLGVDFGIDRRRAEYRRAMHVWRDSNVRGANGLEVGKRRWTGSR